MAITYDVQINLIGGATSTYTGLTSSDYVATSLTASSNYRFRVRAIDTLSGIRYPSPYTAWTNFTTQAAATPVVAVLGLISKTATLNNLTSYVPPVVTIVDKWDLQLTKSGGATSTYNGLTSSDYAATGLDASSSYTFKVRSAKTVNNVIHPSPWVTSSSFNTQATSAPVVAQIGLITASKTLNNLTAIVPPLVTITDTYEIELTEVGVGKTNITGITNSDYVLTGLTTLADYQVRVRLNRAANGVINPSPWTSVLAFTADSGAPQPVVETIGLVTTSKTLNAITGVIGTPTVNSDPTHYVVYVTKDSDSSTVFSGVVFDSQIQVTGLQLDQSYTATVYGVALGALSDPIQIGFTTSAPALMLSTFSSAEQALDIFSFTFNHVYDADNNLLYINGTATHNLQSATVVFNSNGVPTTVSGNTFSALWQDGAFMLHSVDELDGDFIIYLDSAETVPMEVY